MKTAYLEEWVPVNVVKDVLDSIVFVNLGSKKFGLDRPVLLRLPVHLQVTHDKHGGT